MGERGPLASGALIDGFRVGQLLHDGRMARLYEVTRDGLDTPALIKVPKLAFGAHPGCHVGFETEQIILERLTGPHVPRFIAKGEPAGDPFLVMERIAGESLAGIAESAPLPVLRVARLGEALAAAVHELHRQSVLHFDLKPANVLNRPDGTAVLIDFGLSRHTQLPDLVEEEFHIPMGTSGWISPEQLGGNRSDPRSDIYAIGVILYQLATGVLPFDNPNSRAGMRRRRYADPVPPRSRNASVPAWLQEIILRCLEIDPRSRYPTAAQLAHDLAHPEQVPLTERAERIRRPNPLRTLRRWFEGLMPSPPATPPPMAERLACAPHVMVAIDLGHRDEALAEAMRAALRRALTAEQGLRVTLLTVREPRAYGEDDAEAVSRGLHTQALVEMRHWAAPVHLPADKMRLHVCEGTDPARALLDYAIAHHVDRIIMGARAHSALRRYLGSVSARVVAEAPCTVTVCRPGRPTHP
jgi:nucleotide-binding universal stress UspA family protein